LVEAVLAVGQVERENAVTSAPTPIEEETIGKIRIDRGEVALACRDVDRILFFHLDLEPVGVGRVLFGVIDPVGDALQVG